MFLTGFSMRASEIAEPMEGEMVNWMKRTAQSVNSIIIGSLPIVNEEKYFNRLLAGCPDGQEFITINGICPDGRGVLFLFWRR
jgi:predicted amidohydrolase